MDYKFYIFFLYYSLVNTSIFTWQYSHMFLKILSNRIHCQNAVLLQYIYYWKSSDKQQAFYFFDYSGTITFTDVKNAKKGHIYTFSTEQGAEIKNEITELTLNSVKATGDEIRSVSLGGAGQYESLWLQGVEIE